MNWYLEVLKKYAEFNGRARRTEYWMFCLINFIIGFVLGFVEGIIGTGSVLLIIYSLAVMIPSIAVSIRRLHDTNRSGWWLLITLIPFIGGIILIIFTAQDSQAGDNQFGPNPKAVAA